LEEKGGKKQKKKVKKKKIKETDFLKNKRNAQKRTHKRAKHLQFKNTKSIIFISFSQKESQAILYQPTKKL